jgi:hypothetical protein
MRLRIGALVASVAAWAVVWAEPVIAVPVYSDTFDGGAPSVWTSTPGAPSVETTPVGDRRFLGEFTDELVVLSLTDLPAHNRVRVEFDLLILRSWDGNNPAFAGPDTWTASVEGEPPLFSATFNNVGGVQTFPNQSNGALNPHQTGAEEAGTLGFEALVMFEVLCCLDAVYHIALEFEHVAVNLVLEFVALGLQKEDYSALGFFEPDESWGFDAVVVTVATVPAPATVLLLTAGLAALAALRHRWTSTGGRRCR